MKISLKNFQSIEEKELEFPAGVTLIQGPSSSGKTAILRAFKACVSNPSGKSHYIRRGAKTAEVEVISNGETLRWERTKSTTNYYHNGQEYLKASRSQASDFCDLGVAYNHRGEILNMSEAWGVLFPFAESDTELFKLFETVFGLGNTSEVIGTAKGDETAIKKDIFDTEAKIGTYTEKQKILEEIIPSIKKNPSDVVKKVLQKKWNELEALRSDFKTALNCQRAIYPKMENFATNDLEVVLGELNNLESDLKIAKSLSRLPKDKYSGYDFEIDLCLKEWQEMYNDCLEYIRCLNEKGVEETKKFKAEQEIRELQDKLSSIDTCPLCGSKLKGGLQ